jgi:hypothetical protein
MICKKCETEINGPLDRCPFCEEPLLEYSIKKVIAKRKVIPNDAIVNIYVSSSDMIKKAFNNETDYKIKCYKDAYLLKLGR